MARATHKWEVALSGFHGRSWPRLPNESAKKVRWGTETVHRSFPTPIAPSSITVYIAPNLKGKSNA